MFLIEPVFQLILKRANLVVCASPHEMNATLIKEPCARALYLPIGVDHRKLQPSAAGSKSKQILIVCDFREHRKRVDLALAAVQRVMCADAGVSLAMVGSGSNTAWLAATIEGRTRRLGYLDEAQLIALYQDSSVFLLLSDCEAFGIPIVEALFCGTRAVINDTPEMHSLYCGMPGVWLVDNRDEIAVDAAIAGALAEEGREGTIRGVAVGRFASEVTYQAKLAAVLKSRAKTREDTALHHGSPST